MKARQIPRLRSILYYPWHVNSRLNYFQNHGTSWFLQCSTLQIKHQISKEKYIKTLGVGWGGGFMQCIVYPNNIIVILFHANSVTWDVSKYVKWFQDRKKSRRVWRQSCLQPCENSHGLQQTVFQLSQPDCRPSQHRRWCARWSWQWSGDLYLWLAHLLNTMCTTTSVPSLAVQHRQ